MPGPTTTTPDTDWTSDAQASSTEGDEPGSASTSEHEPGSTSETETETEDEADETEADAGGEPETVCDAFGSKYAECFPEEAADEGFDLCAELLDSYAPEGEACVTAVELWVACRAALDCPTWHGEEEVCSRELDVFERACPDEDGEGGGTD